MNRKEYHKERMEFYEIEIKDSKTKGKIAKENYDFHKRQYESFVNVSNQESNHSPSQQSSVDTREIVHTKKISDVGENPILDTKFANSTDAKGVKEK